MKRSEAVELITYTGELWPNYTLPSGDDAWDLRVHVWVDMLGDLPQGVVVNALRSLNADGREHPPTPGLIRQRAVDLIAPSAVPPPVDAAIAEIRRHIHEYGDPGFAWSHPAIGDVVDAVGAWEIQHSENQDTLRAHLRDLYRSVVARHDHDRYSGTLPELGSTGRRELSGGERG